MDITDKLTTPLVETKYLSADNADRYRSIMRLFYLNYEKMKYWMYQEEVYEELHTDPYFAEYTMEQCQQDLKMLEYWNNLLATQDTRKAASLEEFKNKKFRYQLSEYSVEIERMVVRLENLSVEGASLEPTLLERICQRVAHLEQALELEEERLYGWWNDLTNDFRRLNQNYQDYMRDLNSMKAEEMMQSRAFLLFKDRLVDYLRGFVKNLQLNVGKIEQYLRHADKAVTEEILDRVTAYEKSMPILSLEAEVQREGLRERRAGQWESICSWFIGTARQGSEAAKVFDATNEMIRKITRYAARISEAGDGGANRREEYHKLAVLFGHCGDLQEAHRLAAMVFGIERPVHLKGDWERKTESSNSGVYEEEPLQLMIAPRVRNYREKAKRSGITDRSQEKEAAKQAELARMKEEQTLLKSYIKEDCLDFAQLPVLEPHTRDVFLLWLSKALENKERSAKTEDGRRYHVVEPENQRRCVLHSTDGQFQMPAFRILFDQLEEPKTSAQ